MNRIGKQKFIYFSLFYFPEVSSVVGGVGLLGIGCMAAVVIPGTGAIATGCVIEGMETLVTGCVTGTTEL